jgi:oligoribonuclease
MTGLNPEQDELCEIAIIITDSELNPVDEGLAVVIKPSNAAFSGMGHFVRDMHSESGLLEELESGVGVEQAEAMCLAYLGKHLNHERTSPLAGNSVGTDRVFLAKYMPELEKKLHYRNVDVSSLKELARRWYPRVYFQLPKKNGNHRALQDILDSIAELKFYRQTILVAQPGPSSTEAKKVADKI